MGGKHSTEKDSDQSLNPQEKRRLTTFLEKKGNVTHFNHAEMKRLWENILVPDLLKSYSDFLMRASGSKRHTISRHEFVLLYVGLVRGTMEEKTAALIDIIGSTNNPQGQKVLSFNSLCKYLCDLLESYFLEFKSENEIVYRSWTQTKQPDREIMEQVMRGLCNDLQRTNDEVRIDLFERWFHHMGLINVLHNYVLGAMYSLEPEVKSSLIPYAKFPTSKTPTLLDLSQVLYLNSFLPSEYKMQWRFLFSTVSHGESFSKLANCIINQGPILLVVESNEKNVFGAFVSTNMVLGPKWTGSSDSFLFKLYPSVDVYPATGYNNHYAYLNMNQSTLPNGLGMGGQFNFWGLWIDSQFGLGECSESCTTFKNYKMLSLKKKFNIRTLEVWAVGEPPPTDEERGERSALRGTVSVLDRDSVTTNIMELAGRKMFSKGVREEDPSSNK